MSSDSVLTTLREKHPRFSYDSYAFSLSQGTLKVQFFFTLDPDIHFTTELIFNKKLDQKVIANWLFYLGMVESLSYWKAACSPSFVIAAGYLNEQQLTFWHELLKKGLSEFFFVNQINGWVENFVEMKVVAPQSESEPEQTVHKNRVLIPVGGGKDSAVTLEMLKESGLELATSTVNENDQILSVLAASHVSAHIQISRTLDPKLLELNNQGYLNGHTPFSAMLAFSSTFAAYLYDYQYVALSNEWSANEGNVEFLGQTINHQYSKTVEFERNFRNYVYKYLSTTVEYFSFLRPLHELQIANLFTHSSQYFPVFLSCNRGQKTGHWCTECPKCLFVYIMLSPFLDQQTLVGIFGQDLLAKESLLPILNELAGVTECKSLECVGTREETVLALHMTLKKYQNQELPILLQYAKKIIGATSTPEEFLNGFQTPHFLPEKFEELLKKNV